MLLKKKAEFDGPKKVWHSYNKRATVENKIEEKRSKIP